MADHPNPPRDVTPAATGSGSAADEPTRVSQGAGPSRGYGAALEAAHIEGYELHEEIHRGGQGVVYRATQLGTKRQVALKVLLEGPFAGQTARRRFEREVELAASLRHPNIVTILDSGISHGRYFFAMEFIEGLRLDQALDRDRPPLAETLALLEQICEAVNFAHQRGVIHRDLKPSNILVDEEGQPRVLDFGLAKGAQTTADPQQTTVRALSTTGQVLGTLAYMSPEQAGGAQDIDVRSDVYSLGVVMYEALLGQPPYPVVGPLGEVLHRIARDEPIPPRTLRSKSRFGRAIDDELETILLKALEKAPGRRYQTAGDLGRDLRHYLDGEPIEAKRASGFYMLKKTVARYRWQAAAAALMLAMLVTFLAVFAFLYTRESYARAEQERLRIHASEEARRAGQAEVRERQAREQAERSAQIAITAARELHGALVQQKIQRGDLAHARGDLPQARDSYWDAYYDELQDPAARWALRRYYLDTPDNGARLLWYGGVGPVALSPDRRLAAVGVTSDAISVHRIQSGANIAWLRTPRPVQTLWVDDEGRVAAAGRGWAALWEPGAVRPRTWVRLPANFEPDTVAATSDDRWLIVLGGERLRCYDSHSGALRAEQLLPAQRSGPADYSATRQQLAVPIRTGAELATVQTDGTLDRQHIAWAESSPPRAVRFVGPDRLAVLGDGIALIELREDGNHRWTRLADAATGWELFDVTPDADVITLGTRDGRMTVYRAGQSFEAWRVASGGLKELRFAADGAGLLTVDGGGSLTHWIPPTKKHEHRLIHDGPLAAWAEADDGSAVLFCGADGRGALYTPLHSPQPTPLSLPKAMPALSPGNLEDVSLAVSRGGETCVVRRGNRLWLKTSGQPQGMPLRWGHPAWPLLKDVAVSGDGQVLAFCAQTPSGHQQAVAFYCGEPRGTGRGLVVRRVLPSVCRPVAFVGSAIRRLVFVPQSTRLLVARSNGALVLLDSAALPGAPPPPGPREPAPEPLVVLESPAELLACDRQGQRVAAACDDGIVRLLALTNGELLGQINVGQPVAAVAFNTPGDVLLVRLGDGGLSLYELRTLERLAQWSFPVDRQPPLATWIGADDALLLAYDGAVFEHRYAAADRLIEQNRLYARQRRIARYLADGAVGEAWAAAAELRRDDDRQGHRAQAAVLEQQLHRAAAQVPAEWLEEVLGDADAHVFLRIGHAAYGGRRFDLARLALKRGRTLAGGDVDAYTLWRIAGCDYLADRLEPALDVFAALDEREGLDASDVVLMRLQRLAALTFAGRLAEANTLFDQLVTEPSVGDAQDPVAAVAAVILGGYLLGHEGESQLTANFKSLLTVFQERWLLYRDDLDFFAGEKARQRGQRDEARTRYQRCIDLARDTWPADWAHYRLGQLANED